MKIIYQNLIILLYTIFSTTSFCQTTSWQQTGGPYGGSCSSLLSCNGELMDQGVYILKLTNGQQTTFHKIVKSE